MMLIRDASDVKLRFGTRMTPRVWAVALNGWEAPAYRRKCCGITSFDKRLVVAVGVHARRALPGSLWTRHPANGGKSAFRLGLINAMASRR